MVALSRVVPRKLAMEMLFTGEPIDARRALEAGLINVIAAPDKIEETVGALIAKITRFSPFVIGLGKRAFYRQVEMAQDDAYAFTKDVMTSNAAADAAREGIAAFLEKRPPRF